MRNYVSKMKIDLRKYELNKHYLINDDVDFSSHVFQENYRIRKILKCHVDIDLVNFEDITDIKIHLKGQVVGACSYTNEDVTLPFNIKEDMTFSNDEYRGADYLMENDLIELDPYIFALIDANIPLNIHKPGAKMPSGGNGYEVLSEEEYLKKKQENKGSSPWDILDNLDFGE